jgi:hypothetical protein
MTRSILRGLLALLSVAAVPTLSLAFKSGEVGDPCLPEDEYNADFAGFNLVEENIESRSFQCETRICLVNHFQGRVSCPAGQAPPEPCHGTGDTRCPSGKSCVLSQTYAPSCTPCDPKDLTCIDTCTASGFPNPCDGKYGYCGCTTGATISGVQFSCEPATDCSTANCPPVLKSYVCHTPATPTTSSCQTSADTVMAAKGKDCCVPGTDTPVSVSVCGQCDALSRRDAEEAVYCSCRCCVPCCPRCEDGTGLCPPRGEDPRDPSCSTDTSICGPACDPNYNYCSCPGGYSCVGVRSNVGLGDGEAAGAYCLRSGTAYSSSDDGVCGAGNVGGYVGGASCVY